MDTDSDHLLQNLGSLFHELREATMFLLGACDVLLRELPETAGANQLLEELGNAQWKLYKEIDTLPHIIDWKSAINASAQLRSHAMNELKDVTIIANLINQIKLLNLSLEDNSLNQILN